MTWWSLVVLLTLLGSGFWAVGVWGRAAALRLTGQVLVALALLSLLTYLALAYYYAFIYH